MAGYGTQGFRDAMQVLCLYYCPVTFTIFKEKIYLHLKLTYFSLRAELSLPKVRQEAWSGTLLGQIGIELCLRLPCSASFFSISGHWQNPELTTICAMNWHMGKSDVMTESQAWPTESVAQSRENSTTLYST
jgi:hypothetical protein